jgi:hypothetical protein
VGWNEGARRGGELGKKKMTMIKEGNLMRACVLILSSKFP